MLALIKGASFHVAQVISSAHSSLLVGVYADIASVQDAAVGPLLCSRVRIRLPFAQVYALKSNVNSSASSTAYIQVQYYPGHQCHGGCGQAASSNASCEDCLGLHVAPSWRCVLPCAFLLFTHIPYGVGWLNGELDCSPHLWSRCDQAIRRRHIQKHANTARAQCTPSPRLFQPYSLRCRGEPLG